MVSSVHWYGHVIGGRMVMLWEGGWSCLEEGGWSCLEEGGWSCYRREDGHVIGGRMVIS